MHLSWARGLVVSQIRLIFAGATGQRRWVRRYSTGYADIVYPTNHSGPGIERAFQVESDRELLEQRFCKPTALSQWFGLTLNLTRIFRRYRTVQERYGENGSLRKQESPSARFKSNGGPELARFRGSKEKMSSVRRWTNPACNHAFPVTSTEDAATISQVSGFSAALRAARAQIACHESQSSLSNRISTILACLPTWLSRK